MIDVPRDSLTDSLLRLNLDANGDSLEGTEFKADADCHLQRLCSDWHWVEQTCLSCSSLALTLVPLYTVQLAAVVAQQFTHARRMIRCTSADSASSWTQGSSELEVRVRADGANAEPDASFASLNCHRKRPLPSPWRCPTRRLHKSAPINPSTLVRL